MVGVTAIMAVLEILGMTMLAGQKRKEEENGDSEKGTN